MAARMRSLAIVVVKLAENGQVEGIGVKRAEPPSAWIWGFAAARRGSG
jgi:hypothetical protein